MKIKSILKTSLTVLGTFLLVASCTDLKLEQTDSIFEDEDVSLGFSGVPDVEGALNGVYGNVNGMLGDQANFFALQVVTTDEQLVPTRGTDWGDNGVWRTLHSHTWDATHGHILTVWNQLNRNVYLTTEIIDPQSNASTAQLAHAKFVRAFSMYWVMDMWGQVPFRDPNDSDDTIPTVMSRTEAFDFIEQDLMDALAGLPDANVQQFDNQAGGLERATKAAANFLLARLYLNAHVYKGTGSADNSDMQKVIDHVNAIEADGFTLQAGFFELFGQSADSETIFYGNIGKSNRIYNGLHYHQVAPDNGGGGWNGFSTLAEFYDMFEGPADDQSFGAGQEERRGWVPDANTADPSNNFGIGFGFLMGQQYDANGNKLKDRAGNDLVFTKQFKGLSGNGEAEGMRLLKYHPAIDGSSWTGHEIIFRYADAHLMRAEAMMRSGAGDALAEVNELRAIRNASALGSLTEDEFLSERGREMYSEWIRRVDMIRFGQFSRDWEFKDANAIGDDSKNLFPLPSGALLTNPGLTQNPGY